LNRFQSGDYDRLLELLNEKMISLLALTTGTMRRKLSAAF
jgi:hypothetical protein